MYPSLLGTATSFAAAAETDASMPAGKRGQSECGSVGLRSPTCAGLFTTIGEVTKVLHKAGCSRMQYSCSAKFVPARSVRITGGTGVAGRSTPGLSAAMIGSFHIVTLPVIKAQIDWLESCSVVPVGMPLR